MCTKLVQGKRHKKGLDKMNDNFKMVSAHEVKPGNVVNMLEGPKTVVKCQYMKNNTTIQFTFADGSKVKSDQFAPVFILK